MMRSESREIYGVNVFPMIAMCHQFKKWRTIRLLRKFWQEDRKLRNLAIKCGYRSGWYYFNYQNRYQLIKIISKSHQQLGDI